MSIRWLVRPGEEGPVAAVVARAGGDADAIADGRVFRGRRRVRQGDEPAAVGDELTIAPARSTPAASDAVILARADDLVFVDKPAGIPTIPDHGGAGHSLLAVVARTLAVDASRIHPTSRLDREVSGVVTFALSSQAAARLLRAREGHSYARRYVAIAGRPPSPASGVWDVAIGRARDPRHRAPNGKDATHARTLYAAAASLDAATMLALAPITGRTHQLRVHASHAGAPLLGDRVYHGATRVTLATGRVLAIARIALHAARVEVPSSRSEPLVVSSPIPSDLDALWRALGGDSAAWQLALACELDVRSM